GYEPAAVAAEVEHDRLRAFLAHAFDRFAEFTVRTRAERRKRDDTDLLPFDRLHGRGDDRLGDRRAGELHSARFAMRGLARLHLDLHVGPGRPLDQRGGLFRVDAAERAAVDADDQFARLQARAGGRRGVEDARDQQSLLERVDLDPDPREVRRRVEFFEFMWGQVVREAVPQARDRARDGTVVELG